MRRQTVRKYMFGRYVSIFILGMALTALFLGGSAVAGVLGASTPATAAAFAAGSGPAPLAASCSTPGFNPAVNYGAGGLPDAVIVRDFNRDGYPDIVVANDATVGTIGVMLGNGSGGFGAFTTFPVYSNAHDLAADDFNNDGNLDLAVATG